MNSMNPGLQENTFRPSNIVFDKREDMICNEVTSEESDAINAIEPLTWQILVMPKSVEEQTESGIILAKQTVENENRLNMIGKVLSLGPLAFNAEKYQGTTPYAAGDYVAYGQYAGKRINLKNGKTVVLLDDDHIICRIHNADLIDRS